MKNLIKLANSFLKLSQQVSVQAGDIADKFPEFFPRGGSGKGPLDDKIITFVSGFLPQDVNASIFYIVKPGFIPTTRTTFSKEGGPITNAKWSAMINNFVVNEMKSMPSLAKERFSGASISAPVEVAHLDIS